MPLNNQLSRTRGGGGGEHQLILRKCFYHPAAEKTGFNFHQEKYKAIEQLFIFFLSAGLSNQGSQSI